MYLLLVSLFMNTFTTNTSGALKDWLGSLDSYILFPSSGSCAVALFYLYIIPFPLKMLDICHGGHSVT